MFIKRFEANIFTGVISPFLIPFVCHSYQTKYLRYSLDKLSCGRQDKQSKVSALREAMDNIYIYIYIYILYIYIFFMGSEQNENFKPQGRDIIIQLHSN